MNTELKKQITSLPRSPGVYLFKTAEGEILYVGKAISLKDRVGSYFSQRLAEERGPHLVEMTKRARLIETIQTEYELAAIILEAKLIRKNKPTYNLKLRDDKSFAVITIDYNADYPTVGIKREVDLERTLEKLKKERSENISQKVKNIEYFGPYVSTFFVQKTLKTLRKAFKFCDCSPDKFRRYQRLNRGCFYYLLDQCSGPCLGLVSKEEYRKQLEPLRQFLKGNQVKVIRDLESAMVKAKEKENFEQAARLRDEITALFRVQQAAYFSHLKNVNSGPLETGWRIEAYDISNISGQHAVGSMIVAFISQGELKFARHFYRRFKIKNVPGIDDIAMLKEVIERRIKRIKNPSADWQKPNLLMIDGGKGHFRLISQVLTKEKVDIPLIAVAKGPTRKKVDLYYSFKFADFGQESLDSKEKLTKIAERLREEAHRLAISYYRNLHRKSLVSKKTSVRL